MCTCRICLIYEFEKVYSLRYPDIKSDYFVKVGNVQATMFRYYGSKGAGAAKRRKEGEPKASQVPQFSR